MLSYAGMFVAVSSAICAATPTPKEDLFMGKYIYTVIEVLAINVGRAKEKAGDSDQI